MRQEAAALRNFYPAYDRSGSMLLKKLAMEG
jgi:hypothetical protein